MNKKKYTIYIVSSPKHTINMHFGLIFNSLKSKTQGNFYSHKFVVIKQRLKMWFKKMLFLKQNGVLISRNRKYCVRICQQGEIIAKFIRKII